MLVPLDVSGVTIKAESNWSSPVESCLAQASTCSTLDVKKVRLVTYGVSRTTLYKRVGVVKVAVPG